MKEEELEMRDAKESRKNKRGEKAITLIALVVSIIVLLILAGISIMILTGENGILQRAGEAGEKTQAAQKEELRRLTQMEAATNLENIEYWDSKGNKAIIPAGFAVSQVEGEKEIDNGLVIIDSEGNEFVWIPVIDESKYIRNSTYEMADISLTSYDYDGYLPSTIEDEKKVVMNAGGFYIARYETGKEIKNNEYVPVSKERAVVWCNITQPEAQTTAESFISNRNVVSALISGTQWDVTMEFVNNKEGFIVTEALDNRHIGSLTVSGQNQADKVCNIYDLEGNAWEYIAEKNTYSSSSPYNRRGSYYNGSNAASYRSSCNGKSSSSRSFRMVLYVINP